MSSNQYSSHHLTRVGESSQHRDTKLSDTSRDRSAMGSMVSALSTVFCGSSKHADSGTEYIVPASTGSGIPHNYTLVKNRQNLSCEGPPILARRTALPDTHLKNPIQSIVTRPQKMKHLTNTAAHGQTDSQICHILTKTQI